MGIIDLLTGLFAVKQLVKLWPEMAKDLNSVFLGMKPFSSPFLYIFRLLNFFFSSDYYAILIPNSFTLVHFCTLMPPLQLVFFCFVLKTIDTMTYLNLCLTTKTAIHHFIKNSFLPLQHTEAFLFFFLRPSTGTSQVKTFTQKKTKTKKQKKGKNNSNLSLLMLYLWSN